MTPADGKTVYRGRWTGAICISIGVAALGCGTAVAFVATDPLLACLLMGFPASFLGLMALLAGIAAVAARIEVSDRWLRVAAPQWRGCPLPPVRLIQIEWEAITAVRHRVEVYHLLPGRGLPFPVDAYAIDFKNDRLIFAGKSIPHLAQAVSDIAVRSGRPIQEAPPVRADVVGSLLKGPPHWLDISLEK